VAKAPAAMLGRLWRWLLIVTVAGAATITADGLPERPETAASAGEGWRFKPAERCLMRKVNGARQRRGLARLRWSRQVGYVARRHARRMARARGIWHHPRLGRVITRWDRLGQNVGRGAGCRQLFRAFMSSSKHRSIILGTWRFMGAGVVRAGGRMYVHQVFEWHRRPGNIHNYP
jgi:hypothetical protein